MWSAVRHGIVAIRLWGCLTVAGLLLAGCSFEPGGGSSFNRPGADAGSSPGDAAAPVPDGNPASLDAIPPVIPASELLETLTIQADTEQAVLSTVVLELEKTYTLIAKGEVEVRDDGWSGDADYYWADFAEDLPGDESGGVDIGLAVNDVSIDGNRSPNWGAYTTSHTYQVDMPGTGATLTAQYHDPNYGNNSGSMTLEIWGPPP